MLYGTKKEKDMLRKLYANSDILEGKIEAMYYRGKVLTYEEMVSLYNDLMEQKKAEKEKAMRERLLNETPKEETKQQSEDWRVSKDEKFKMMDERWG